MNTVKIPEIGHFYPIVDIHRFACYDHHREFLCYNCLRGFEREETLDNHKLNCYEFHKVPENIPQRPINFHDYRVLRPVPVKICFDTEAFNRIMSKLQQNIIACLPKNHNGFKGVQRVYYCALILDSKPEYLQYLPDHLFNPQKSSTDGLPLYGSFFVPLSTGGGAMFIGLIVWFDFLTSSKRLMKHFWRQLLI